MSTILGDLGALAAGGAALYGAFAGGDNRNRRLSQQQGYQNLELQRRAYYNAIQDRVADARRAGLHPLFALGGSANFSPVPSDMGYADSSEPYRLAAQGIESMGRGLEGLSRRKAVAEIEKDEAETMKLESEAAYWSQRAAHAGDPFGESNPGRPVPQAIITPAGVGRPGPYTPAQAVEEEFGDVVGSAYGIWRALDEARQWLNREWPAQGRKMGLKPMKRRPRMVAPGVWR